MDATPGWVGPTVAISLLVIALAHLSVAALIVLSVRRLGQRIDQVQRRLEPMMQAVDRLAASGEDLGDRIRAEVHQIIKTSRYVRRGVVDGMHGVRRRAREIDALYEVVSGEVEDTALDLAARLRTLRSGASFLQRIKRLLVRGRR